jgi:hypothetical protein
MGADIHLWVETQSDESCRESWRFANPYRIERWEKESWIEWDQPYVGRNYRLFALLADVRNSEPRLTPIALPRGVPLDCSKIGRRVIDEWGADGHDHSWLSVEELLQHPWEQVVRTETHRDMVGDFASEFLPSLRTYGPADRTRIVFFFDN